MKRMMPELKAKRSTDPRDQRTARSREDALRPGNMIDATRRKNIKR